MEPQTTEGGAGDKETIRSTGDEMMNAEEANREYYKSILSELLEFAVVCRQIGIEELWIRANIEIMSTLFCHSSNPVGIFHEFVQQLREEMVYHASKCKVGTQFDTALLNEDAAPPVGDSNMEKLRGDVESQLKRIFDLGDDDVKH
jgi:hypothetical protein